MFLRPTGASTIPIAARNMLAEDYRSELGKHGLRGSIGLRGNSYDNAEAESSMKTLKVDEGYLME